MPKSSNFFVQPIYGQLIKSLDRERIVEMSQLSAQISQINTELARSRAVINLYQALGGGR